MSQVAILLWVTATATANPELDVRAEPTFEGPGIERTFAYTSIPTHQQQEVLDAWADSRNLLLQPPVTTAQSGLGNYDAALVSHIEDLLEQARLSAGSLAEDLASEQLAQAEQIIYGHAELPQAGYLLAEVASQLSRLAETQGLLRLAEIQRQRAITLEGSRARAYTDHAEVQTTTRTQSSPNESSSVMVRGLKGTDLLEWDGAVQASHQFTTTVGEHHARVLREGIVVWAGFVLVHRGLPSIAVEVPAPRPCSASDLAGVHLTRDRVVVEEAVECPLWAIARPAAGPGIKVALCRYRECGPLLEWQRGFGKALAPPLHRPHPFRWPSWAGYVAAGLGAAAATTLVLWQTGAFDEPEPGPTTWRFGGVTE